VEGRTYLVDYDLAVRRDFGGLDLGRWLRAAARSSERAWTGHADMLPPLVAATQMWLARWGSRAAG